MAQSGVKCNDNVKESFTQLQKDKKYSYVCYKIQEMGATAEVMLDEAPGAFCEAGGKEHIGETEQRVKQLRDYLMSINEPRYCIIDVQESIKGRPMTKIVFVLWNLDVFSVKKKMKYAATKEAVIKTCTGIQCQMQVSDDTDLNFGELMELISKTQKN